MQLKVKENWFLFVPAILLFVATADLPYGYYQILRLVVTLYALIFAATFYSREDKISPKVLLLVGIGLLFNPIFPVFLEKDVWVVIDLIVGLFLGLVAFRFLKLTEHV